MTLTLRSVLGTQLSQAQMDANMAEIGYLSSDMPSAATVDLSTATGNIVKITGTTTISSFGTAAPTGTTRILRMSSVLTITHAVGPPGIICPGGQSYVSKSGDVLEFIHQGSGQWRCMGYLAGDGRLLNTALVTFPPYYNNGTTPGPTPTIDCNNGARQLITLSASITTLTVTAPPGPCTTQIDFYQPATGGPWTITWPASFKWPASYGTTDKALSTTASARDRLVLDYDGSVYVANLMKTIA